MTMYQRQQGNGSMMEDFSSTLERETQEVEHLARTLSRHSRTQWQRAIEGLVALPAAIAVGSAATALYAVAFITRGFAVFERTAAEEQRQMQQQRGEAGQQQREELPRA